MKITVWSALTGKLSGHIIMNVPGSYTVQKLLQVYCKHKGVAFCKGYAIRSRDNGLLSPDIRLEETDVRDGDTLTLGYSDDEQPTFAFGSWWIVTIIAFIVSAVGLVATIFAFAKHVPPSIEYAIVMDGGSSHSEIFVFMWDGEKALDTADVKLAHRCFIAGGVSKFVDRVDDLRDYLKNCLKEAETYVPLAYHSKTPFYVGATAGMRILRDFDPEGALLVLKSLLEVLSKDTPFLILPENIAILKGTEEGISGWIAVNYLLKNLKQTKDSTVATLDVGGASMQVTSVVANNSQWTPENIFLFRRNHTVLSQSFLCYGITEAQHRYNFLLTTENGSLAKDETTLIDPCLPEGVTHNITEDDMRGPCTLTDNSKPILTSYNKVNWHKLRKTLKKYRVNEIEEKQNAEILSSVTEDPLHPTEDTFVPIHANGSSNAKMCHEKVERLFNFALCEKTFTYGSCMNSNSIPVINGDLVAFSGVFEHMAVLLNMESGSNLNQFKEAVYDVCTLTSNDLYHRYPDLPKLMVEDLCFDAMYVYTLFTSGLGVDSNEWEKVKFSDKINNTEVDWPLGFTMNRTTYFPADIPPKPLAVSSFILLLLLFGAFFISGILFLHHSINIKRHNIAYQRCSMHQA